TGTSHTGQIALLASWNGTPGHFVQATVSQQQPTYLATVLGFSTVNIGATAVANVKQPEKLPCLLSLSGPITFQDSSVTVTAPNCGLASNGTPTGFDFHSLNTPPVVGSMSTAGGCSGDASLCGKVSTFTPKVIDPFSALTSAMTSPSKLTLTTGCSGLQPYTASNPCSNSFTGSQKSNPHPITQSGVYFFSDLT